MYKNLNKNLQNFNMQIPQTFLPNPSAQDYQLGFIYRYFLQKSNDENAFVYEVSEQTYDDYETNPFWKKVRLKWRISGPVQPLYNEDFTLKDCGVISSNKASLGLASLHIKNISLYLPHLLQFHRK